MKTFLQKLFSHIRLLIFEKKLFSGHNDHSIKFQILVIALLPKVVICKYLSKLKLNLKHATYNPDTFNDL